MDAREHLAMIVRREVQDYSGPSYKAKTHYIEDHDQRLYTVVIVPDRDYPVKQNPGVVVMVRIVDDKVVIEADITDKPLHEELMQAGIPREQIVLAYAGEAVPESAVE